MKMKSRFVLGAAMSALAMQAHARQPTCSDMSGTWVNQLGSTMDITYVDPATNMISGTYISPSGTSGNEYPLTGWVNSLPPLPNGNNAHVISFSVRWGDHGSITAWTGTCTNVKNTPTISTIWNLVRSNSQFVWDHIYTNSDIFTPK